MVYASELGIRVRWDDSAVRAGRQRTTQEVKGFVSDIKSSISQALGKDMAAELTGRLRRNAADIGRAVGVGMAAVTAGVVAGLKQSITAASDLNEQVTAMQATFKTSAKIVEQFGVTADRAFGLAKEEAFRYASALGGIFKASGLTEKGAAQMSVSVLKLGADLASFKNLSIDEALMKLRSGLVGEVEPLRAVGVLLTENAVKAEAMRLKFKLVGGELSEGQKVMARYSLIMRQTKDAQGDFTRTADGLANQQRIVRAELINLSADLGKDFLPVAKDAVKVLRDLMKQWKDMSEETRKAWIRFGLIAATLAPGAALAVGIGRVVLLIMDIAKAWTAVKVAAEAAAIAQGGAAATGGTAAGAGLLSRFGLPGLAIAGAGLGVKALLDKNEQRIKDSDKFMKSVADVIAAAKKDAIIAGIRDPDRFNEYVVKRTGFTPYGGQRIGDSYNAPGAKEKAYEQVRKEIADLVKSLGSAATSTKRDIDTAFKITDPGNLLTEKLKKAMKGPTAEEVAHEWKSQAKGWAKEFGLTLTSEFRPGARARGSGRPSLHSMSAGSEHGLALDFSGSKQQMAAFFDFVRSTIPSSLIRELTYSPRGRVYNGQYSPRVENDKTRADHYDHVHLALRRALGDSRGDIGAELMSQKLEEMAKAQQKAKEAADAHREALHGTWKEILQVQGASESQLFTWRREHGELSELTQAQYEEQLAQIKRLEGVKASTEAERQRAEAMKATREAVAGYLDQAKEQLALMGATTEAEKARYEVEQGRFKNAGAMEKFFIMVAAKALDAKKAALESADALKHMIDQVGTGRTSGIIAGLVNPMLQFTWAIQPAIEAVIKLRKEQKEAADKKYQDYIHDINKEMLLLTLNTEEARIQQLMLDDHLTRAQAKEVVRRGKQLEMLKAYKDMFEKIADGLVETFLDAFSNITGGFDDLFNSLLGGFRRLFQQIAMEYLKSQLKNILMHIGDVIFGNMSKKGQPGPQGSPPPQRGSSPFQQVAGVLSILGMFGGFRALGGGVTANMPYIVGENGAELFVPASAGTVVSNRSMRSSRSSYRTGDGGDHTVMVNVGGIHMPNVQDYPSFARNRGQMAADVAAALSKAMRTAGA